MSDTWIIYGVQLLTIFVSSGLALASMAVFGRWWVGFQLKRNSKNEDLEPLDENSKNFALTPPQMVLVTMGFTFLYIFLAHKYIEPYVVGLILGR
tara:strand:- start:721 stop:1005 length:285 start_codon:yes stop_codon:yes gene_type:complete